MNHIDVGSMLGTAIGGLGGGSAVVFLAQAYLKRTLAELDSVINAMQQVQKELAQITVRLERFEQNDATIREHDRKIAALEVTVYQKNSVKSFSK